MSRITRLPLVVGFGGFNAAGRSSGHNAYKRMIFESLGAEQKDKVVLSLASMMGLIQCDRGICSGQGLLLDNSVLANLRDPVLNGTLVRKIESTLFDASKVPGNRSLSLECSEDKPALIKVAARDLPDPLPFGWTIRSESAGQCEVEIWKSQHLSHSVEQSLAVQSAGQLPSGFNPGSYYRSLHHPRGLQLAVMAASDAVNSMGIDWHTVARAVRPDEIAVYSSSVMSQLDGNGFGGMLQARGKGNRVSSKQLALGLNSMPADFINAYVLGSVGQTGGITGACATFLYNLQAGVEDIQSGRRRVVVVGSSEAPILPEVIDGYAAMSALATDAELMKLDGGSEVNHRRASRPFGQNCGFTLAESGQYVVLMDDDLALELGAQIFAAVPGVYVNADGYKKSISAPGPGNYLTMAKAVALARNLLGDKVVQEQSFVQAHGSSTPHNRVTESKIFDEVARAFNINHWPVAAVKAYLGHSLGPASGDQMATTLGVFEHGILPGIKTIDSVADDVFGERLHISSTDVELGSARAGVGFLNSKGFGGNNATAAVFAPRIANQLLLKRHGNERWQAYQQKLESTLDSAQHYELGAQVGELGAIYRFGENMVDENAIELSDKSISIPGYQTVQFDQTEGYDDLK